MAPSHSAQEHSSAWCKQLHVDSCPLPVQRVVEQQLPTLFHSNAGHWHIDASCWRSLCLKICAKKQWVQIAGIK